MPTAVEYPMIDLTSDDVVIAPPSSLREGAIAALDAGTNHRIDFGGLAPLRKAVADKLANETEISWDPADIAITASADEAIIRTVLAILDPGDEAIVIRPCRPTFPILLHLAGVTPVLVDARRPRYLPDISAIRAAVTPKTKAIVINSPNDPTGAVYDRTTLQKIGELAMRFQLWIISDERYSRFIFTWASHHRSIVMTHPDVRPLTIVVKAFSNELAATGWRLSYIAAPAEVAFAASRLQSHTTTNPSAIAQHAILHHLQVSDGSFEREVHQRLAYARNAGLHILSDLRDVAISRADGSFFFYLDLSRLVSVLAAEGPIQSSDDIVRLLLDEANVKCVPGSVFGDVNGLRISFGAPPDLLEVGLRSIVKTLNRLRRS
ncbi:aspartate aminotransferase [Bradyrhizobium sp. F1.13.1]